jgi:hypothetical protein
MMKPKKTPLTSALAAAANGTTLTPAEAPLSGRPRGAALGATTARVDRSGKVNVTGYFDPAVRQSIRMIQAQQPALTQQAILAEALNLVFAKYGVPESAKVGE